jgi:LAGLIDADG endonuclease
MLPCIGTVSGYALKKWNKNIRLNKKKYLTIPSTFIAFLVGLIDRYGYIKVTITNKGFITIKLVISIHLDDIYTLQYIQSILKLGKITENSDHRSPTCKLIISRTDLQVVIFPLLLHHGIFFLTYTRRAQFDLAMFILKKDNKVYDEIPSIKNIPTLFELPKTASYYVKLEVLKI